MRLLLGLTLALMPLFITVGCGESRPDPRENPEFDEEAYNDVNKTPGVDSPGGGLDDAAGG